MAYQKERQERWIFATSLTLSILSAIYFFLLFPRETTSVVMQYMNYIVVVLIAILSLSLTVMLLRKNKNKESNTVNTNEEKNIKRIEQIIWRNRYVLQSKKTHLINDGAPENRDIWNEDKKKFARKFVFPIIPESEVSIEVVSELVEKSLRGGSIGGIRPPTYNVQNVE